MPSTPPANAYDGDQRPSRAAIYLPGPWAASNFQRGSAAEPPPACLGSPWQPVVPARGQRGPRTLSPATPRGPRCFSPCSFCPAPAPPTLSRGFEKSRGPIQWALRRYLVSGKRSAQPGSRPRKEWPRWCSTTEPITGRGIALRRWTSGLFWPRDGQLQEGPEQCAPTLTCQHDTANRHCLPPAIPARCANNPHCLGLSRLRSNFTENAVQGLASGPRYATIGSYFSLKGTTHADDMASSCSWRKECLKVPRRGDGWRGKSWSWGSGGRLRSLWFSLAPWPRRCSEWRECGNGVTRPPQRKRAPD